MGIVCPKKRKQQEGIEKLIRRLEQGTKQREISMGVFEVVFSPINKKEKVQRLFQKIAEKSRPSQIVESTNVVIQASKVPALVCALNW
jgi:fatty acid-binding protein DegV